MRKIKSITSLLLLLALAVSLSAPAAGTGVKDITLQPGSSENEINFCWHSPTGGGTPWVRLAESAGLTLGVLPADAAVFTGTASPAPSGYDSCRVTATALSPNTSYSYIVGSGSAVSGVYSFTTGDSASYRAVFVSDAQIGASGSSLSDMVGWEKTLSASLERFPDTSFILSGGDQVDYYLQSEYDAFLSSPLLRQYPLATAAGNHENLSGSRLHTYYYNEPNESAVYGVTSAGGDYWFTYGSVLYLVLNSNDPSISEHDAFIRQALEANPDAGWRVLMFHHSLYSSAGHTYDSTVKSLRTGLTPVIDKYGIDLVLSGHDHCYSRTFPLRDGVTQAGGTVYITAGSASGSKYYALNSTPEAYAAVRLQPEVPTYLMLTVSAGALTLDVYRTDTQALIDTFTLSKPQASAGSEATAPTFSDVLPGAWYYTAVTYLAEKGITSGTAPGIFSPDAALTRAQFLVLLMRAYDIAPDAAGTDNFADAGISYYTGYLAAAKRLGLAGGVGSNLYLPEAVITRQDMFVLLYNTLVRLGKLPAGTASPLFTDGGLVAPYAEGAVTALASCGVVTGSGGFVDPYGRSTRAQLATLLYRLLAPSDSAQLTT